MSTKSTKNERERNKSSWNSVRDKVGNENRLREFVRDGSPGSWLEYGEELRDAAEVLWSAELEALRLDVRLNQDRRITESEIVSTISRPYLFLAGLSLENILKGLMIVREPGHITRGVLSKELKTHNVRLLCNKISSLILSADEEKFVQQVTDAIPYWGRYPIPLEQNGLMPSVAITPCSRKIFLELFERLAGELYWSVRDGWDSGIGVETVKMRSNRYGDRIGQEEKLFEP